MIILQANGTDFFVLGMGYPEPNFDYDEDGEAKSYWDDWDIRLYDLDIVNLANEYLRENPPRFNAKFVCVRIDHCPVTVGTHYLSRLKFDIEINDEVLGNIPVAISSLSEKATGYYSAFLREHCSFRSGYVPYGANTPQGAASNLENRGDHWEADARMFLMWVISLHPVHAVSWDSFVSGRLEHIDPYKYQTN